MTETHDRRRSLAEPYTPGSGNGDEPWDAEPDTVAVAPPSVPGRDERTTQFLAEWHNGSYNCFSSGHKFCREVCPVVQVTRNESWSPDGLPRQRRGDGARPPRRRRRGHRLRQLHAVRGMRAALPEHAVHRRLLPVPHPHRRRRQGDASAGRRPGRPPAGVAALERVDRRAHPRARARRHVGQPGARSRLGRRPRPADRRRDDPVRRLRGRVLSHLGAAGGGPDPSSAPATSSG